MKRRLIVLTLLIVFTESGCTQVVAPGKAKEIEADTAATQVAIKAAEAEDALYSGGLVKSLIAVRLATLRQTEGMLQQVAKSWHFGIALKYTVDGKAFVPPKDADTQIAAIQQELQALQSKIRAQQADTDQYSGGLVRAMGLSTIATMRQTEAMLDQRRLALKYALPQFIAFAGSYTVAPQALSPGTIQPAPQAPAVASRTRDWDIVEVDSRVTERNDTWWRYAWKLTLKNKSESPQRFEAEIEFQDADGFVIDSGSASGLIVPANSDKVFTGYELVRTPGAARVAKTNAKVNPQ